MPKAPAQLIETIFAQALTIEDLQQRQAYLEEACAGDADLFQELTDLLHAYNHPPAFLQELLAKPALDLQLAPVQTKGIQHSPPEIPGYRLEHKLGEGAMGEVYLAHDEKLLRPVALKLIRHAKTAEDLEQVMLEARHAAALQDRAVVTVYSVLEDISPPVIVMEYIEGFPCDQATAALTVAQKASVLQEIARALALAHKRGIIHRDLKPTNILLTPTLQPKILDFGLAIGLEHSPTSSTFRGTPHYTSPEQVLAKPITTAADIFSFGSLMFRILTGRHPFEGETTLEILQKVSEARPPFLRDLSMGIPEDLQAICLACLAQRPEDRPSAEDLVLDLGRYLAGEPVHLRPALYTDILRQKISGYSKDLVEWERQGLISKQEKDSLDVIHRQILADEDHWIVNPRKISVAQTLLYTGAWLSVVAAALFVWLLQDEMQAPFTWLIPTILSAWLFGAGFISFQKKELLASGSFLAGAVLSTIATSLALFRAFGFLEGSPPGVQQLFPNLFSNQQLLGASGTALLFSLSIWSALRLTGFAWTSALLLASSYLSLLLCLNWLDQPPETKALWLLPFTAVVSIGFWTEKIGRVRWSLPFYLLSLATLVFALDVIAYQGPTLRMLGFTEEQSSFFNPARQQALSLALNGALFLLLLFLAERSSSLHLRRSDRFLEPLALLHLLGPLYLNARAHQDDQWIWIDFALYGFVVLLFLFLGPYRSRWRMLVGSLGGLALGSHLLLDLNLVSKTEFILTLGFVGLVLSALTYGYLITVPNKPRKLKK